MRDHWAQPLSEEVVRRTDRPFSQFEDGRDDVDSYLPDAHSVFYFGHGSADALGDPALIDATNVGHVDGMLVAIACNSAQTLGPAAVAGGTRTYVGFIDELPIPRASVYDSFVVDSLAALAAGEECAGDFDKRFRRACDDVRDRYLATRDKNAHLIGLSAQVTKLALQVLGDPATRC